jgi:hypothetical protein
MSGSIPGSISLGYCKISITLSCLCGLCLVLLFVPEHRPALDRDRAPRGHQLLLPVLVLLGVVDSPGNVRHLSQEQIGPERGSVGMVDEWDKVKCEVRFSRHVGWEERE